jgi:TonB-linked SusC/RagA family outer membrane protein
VLALAAALLAFGSAEGRAQGGSVGGVVVSERSLLPIAGAQVRAVGSDRGTLADASGRFLLSGLSGGDVVLEVVMIGYRTATQTVRVGATDVRIVLSETAISLDGIVVTGTAGGTQKRAIGNAVAQVNAAEVVKVAPIKTVQELINGRAPGVVIMPGSGTVGSGAKIRVRGVSSLSLAQEPLIYVDGVRVDNAQATGPINQAFGSSVISRWNDFNPEDIESIEIIKGPAAATLYGTEAANGVVQIITKKGAQGTARFDLTVSQGVNWFANPQGRLWTNYGVDPNTKQVTTIDYKQLEQLWGKPIFQNGHLQQYKLSVSGGSPAIRYYVGGNLDRDEGIEPNNKVKRLGGRANLSIFPSDKIDVTTSVGYVAARTDLPLEAGGGGVTWTTYYSTPATLGKANNGFYSATPDAYYYAYQDWQNMSRFTGSVQINHRPFPWLKQRLTVGTDITRESNVEMIQHIEDEAMQVFFDPDEIRGYKDIATRNATYSTFDYSATVSAPLSSAITSNTSVGGQYYRRFSEYLSAYGEGFPVRGLKAINAATLRQSGEDYVENATVGVYAQQQFDWKGRLFLTGALRADDNSAFGENFDLAYYPKVSGTWVISEEPFWSVGAINQLRLRGAYGQSGQQPQSFAALRTYAPIPGPGDVGTVTPQLIGNPDLGPERSRELELGFDAGFLEDRLGLELTYYSKRTTDAILLRDIAPSTGFPGSQYINAGEVSNTGLELLARFSPIRKRTLGWDLSLSVATNDNKVVTLGVDKLTYVSAGSYMQHHEGYPVSAWFDKRIVGGSFNEKGMLIAKDGKPVAESALCDDGKGGTVACTQAPAVFLGRPTPKTEGAFTSTLTLFGNLRLHTLVDFKLGYHKMDGDARVRCVLFGRCRENFYPTEYLNDPAWLAQTQLGSSYASGLIRDASFGRLREVSLNYALPRPWARRLGAEGASITVAGRNLGTWTRYTGLEPEASFLGGSRGVGQWEQNVTPQLAQFVTTLNINF